MKFDKRSMHITVRADGAATRRRFGTKFDEQSTNETFEANVWSRAAISAGGPALLASASGPTRKEARALAIEVLRKEPRTLSAFELPVPVSVVKER